LLLASIGCFDQLMTILLPHDHFYSSQDILVFQTAFSGGRRLKIVGLRL